MKIMYCFDNKYEYSSRRNGKKTEQVPGPKSIAVAIEEYHDWYIRDLLKDSDVYFERKIKTR